MRLRIAAGVGVGGVRGMDRLVWGDRSGLCGGSRVGGARGGGGGRLVGEWESDWMAGQAHPVRGSQGTKKGRVRMTHDPAPKGGTTVSALRGDAVTHGPLYGR